MSASRLTNLSGRTFSRLTVLSYAGRAITGEALWHCRCTCGNKVLVRSDSLVLGRTKSCGCYRSENARRQISAMKAAWSKPIEALDPQGIRHIFATTHEAAEWAGCTGQTVSKYAKLGKPYKGYLFRTLR